MWWIVFTAVDLYIGLVVLDALIPSLPAEKRRRANVAKEIVVVLLVLLAIALAAVLIKRWSVQA
jgi:uncharacterized membrane protein YidH (DUF202 family)